MSSLRSLLITSIAVSSALARNFCTPAEKCWPPTNVWSAFNSSVNGRLLAPLPPAWPCHDPHYDKFSCDNVKSHWDNIFWRSDQVGAMQDTVWESFGCDIDTPRNQTCKQGFVPAYSVEAHSASDVSKAVLFAAKHKIQLVVKNTGHDFLGRSSGAGSLSIWTHNLRGINFTESFVADGCPQDSRVPAVTIGAGEQWRDVYKAAGEHKLTVVGGAASSVGAAGGWLQGGGHSPLSSLFGLGVDNVLQFTVVKADGATVKANPCQNKDLFWALRGGGGSTWGVSLDVTYKTHPPTSLVTVPISLNATDSQKLKEFTEVFFRVLPNITDKGIRGYVSWVLPIGFSFFAIHAKSPGVAATNATLKPIFDWADQNPGTQIDSDSGDFPSFDKFFAEYFTGDDGEVGAGWLGGRLVSKEAFSTNAAQLAELAINLPANMGTGLNIVGGGLLDTIDPESTGLNPQWRNQALGSWNPVGIWDHDTPKQEVKMIKLAVTNVTQALGKLGGLDGAAYFNEADPNEPQWKKAFFGVHYDRLLKIKREVDPEGVFTCNRCVGSDN